MTIPTNELLIKTIEENSLIPIEVNTMKISNQIQLNINEVDDFFQIVKNSNCYNVYYYYTYYDSEEYIIPFDWYSEYLDEFKKIVSKHNKMIKSLNFDIPKSLTLFMLQNGTFVGIQLENPWIENQGIYVAEAAIEEIEDSFDHEVKRVVADKEEKRKQDEKELREIIFNDPEFKYNCKNQQLRHRYLANLIQKEGMEKFDYLVEPFGAPHIGNAKMFMDLTYELYKELNNKF
ncbi:hypothetical protein MUN88_17005 [Gracilibacillus caseinilyticus]|uniref:Uncharacterized protein n=1 Tax=Gracilibacillus caseinilyticus TaxID=2932256 RepID=A0ABY4EUI5_9BACI|nr:hypothetical protein [Gracilibacillus caseinilyticus]UOQ47731.1 hypothetical protein MUN88_17005 [Gracilibacillus caseinilyticus]